MNGEEDPQDQLITCVDCGVQFPFSAKDQAFYKERGYFAPRRCKACRLKRKGSAPAGPGGGYGGGPAGGRSGGYGGGQSGGHSGGYGGGHSGGYGGGHSGGGGYGRRPAEAAGRGNSSYGGGGAGAGAGAGQSAGFKVICSSCGVETTVPFKPDPNRLVYCRKCYLESKKPRSS